VDKVTILPRGGAGGYTRFMPDEEVLDSGLITRSSCLADLVVALGGRAAEQVVFGSLEITQGASGDLQMVAQLAREMVTRFGFSNLGPMALEGPGTEVFLGRDWFNQRPSYAESTGQAIDTQIRQLAKSALAQAIALLEPRRELMDQLVDVLIAEETINGDRFRDIAGLP
jgi:cell division protease FtsH